MTAFSANLGICHRCPQFPRDAMGAVPCDLTGIDIAVHARADWCTAGRFGVTERPADLVVPEPGAVVRIPPWGPRLWQRIHGCGDALTNQELDAVERRLPCGECVAEFRAYRLRRPLGKFESGWQWSWRCHNAVNRRLGKPVMTWSVFLRTQKKCSDCR